MGFSPYYLMYGQNPHILINLYFNTQTADMNATTSMKFVMQLHERLRWAYKNTQQVTEGENKRHKWNYQS